MPKQLSKRRKKKGSKPNLKVLFILVAMSILLALVFWWISRPAEDKDAGPGGYDPGDSTQTQAAVVDLDQKLQETLTKLGVPDNGYRRRRRSDEVVYNVSLDKTVMDLTYANMIIKGAAESIGAQLVSGTETGGRQSLKLKHSGQSYTVNLYYDPEPYAKKMNQTYIAIVVDDFGYISSDLLDGFLALPREVSFAIFPEMQYSVQTMDLAYKQGRETLIHVPMEPIGYPNVDPGSNPILVQMGETEIHRLLNHYINLMPRCIGINNHMGSFATTDADVMGHVMKVLKDRNKGFLDSRTTNVSVAYAIAQKAHIPAYRNDIFLDSPNTSQANLEDKLIQIKALAVTNKQIIAITHCHNREKLVYLQNFIQRLESDGFILIPLSRIGKYDVPEIS
jgi:polysaccharide deacetylase 2 family uncharacterized protein YibQ